MQRGREGGKTILATVECNQNVCTPIVACTHVWLHDLVVHLPVMMSYASAGHLELMKCPDKWYIFGTNEVS